MQAGSVNMRMFQCQCVKGGYTSVLNKIKHFSDFPHILLVRTEWMGSAAKVKEQGLTSHKDSQAIVHRVLFHIFRLQNIFWPFFAHLQYWSIRFVRAHGS